VPAEVALRLDISFIDAAPGSTEKKVCDMSGIEALPLGDLGGGFVFLGAANECGSDRSEFPENLLLQNGAHVRRGGKVGLATRVAAFAAHVDEIGEWLSSGGSFVEIGPLSAERIRRDYTLGLELIVTNWTTKLYLTQRCHGDSSYPLSEPSWK
jgi:hypothetical protein